MLNYWFRFTQVLAAVHFNTGGEKRNILDFSFWATQDKTGRETDAPICVPSIHCRNFPEKKTCFLLWLECDWWYKTPLFSSSGAPLCVSISNQTRHRWAARRFQPPPIHLLPGNTNILETQWDREERMGGKETDHRIMEHLVKSYKWMATFSVYRALPWKSFSL